MLFQLKTNGILIREILNSEGWSGSFDLSLENYTLDYCLYKQINVD